MPAYVNAADFLKIGVLGFLFIWGMNKALEAVQLDKYKVEV